MYNNEPKERVYGWGRTTFSNSMVYRPSSIIQIHSIIEDAKKRKLKITCRGSGRSYGDNTLNSNQIVLDISEMNKILSWDKETGLIVAESGATIEKIILKCVPDGWLFPSMPGTRFVSLAGALGNNVHGKNEFHRGCIGEYVQSFDAILADNKLYTCSRDKNVELFYSIISGIGLLGVIVNVSINLRKIPSYYVNGNVKKNKNFKELIEEYETIKGDFEYSIAWIDAIKSGKGLGRGEINFGNLINDNDYTIHDHEIPKRLSIGISNDFVPLITKRILNVHTMKLVNWLQINLGSMSSDVQKTKVSLSKYHYLMDMKFPKYNFFFKHGFFEYQAILPIQFCMKGFEELLKITHKYGFYSLMSSLKAYRNQKEDFLLHFPLEGFSMTMDIPKEENKISQQVKMFFEMNEKVIEYGGRINFGKTPILNLEHFENMYPNSKEFINIKNKYDPDYLFESNMFRRIMNIAREGCEVPSIYSI